MKNSKVALVTGANRGIGLEASLQLGKLGYEVILGCRSLEKAKIAALTLEEQGVRAIPLALDVSLNESAQAAFEFVQSRTGRLDVLLNNAGVFLDARDAESALQTTIDQVRETFETNTLGAFRMCQLFTPMMKKQKYGRIVNVSSGMGQLSEMNGGYAAYRISKTALNAVTRIFADELADSGVLVNSVCPGWVKTDMGGPGAERPVEKGAETLVWLATLPVGGPSGGFFRDREPIDW